MNPEDQLELNNIKADTNACKSIYQDYKAYLDHREKLLNRSLAGLVISNFVILGLLIVLMFVEITLYYVVLGIWFVVILAQLVLMRFIVKLSDKKTKLGNTINQFQKFVERIDNVLMSDTKDRSYRKIIKNLKISYECLKSRNHVHIEKRMRSHYASDYGFLSVIDFDQFLEGVEKAQPHFCNVHEAD